MAYKSEQLKKAIENELKIVDKSKESVPFILNPAQAHLNDEMGEALEIIVLKARKMGFSSFVLAVMVLKFIFGRNENCVSISFDDSAAKKQLSRAKYFLKSFEMNNGIELPMKYNTKNEMVYEFVVPETGEVCRNVLQIGSARSRSFGRGDDISFLHITEAAFCSDIDELLAGVGEACLPDAHKIFETTANGYNDFKRFWDDAEAGRNGYTPLFYGPEWEYGAEFLNKKKMMLGDTYVQEYPPTAEEAFITSGKSFFDTMVLKRMMEKVINPISL